MYIIVQIKCILYKEFIHFFAFLYVCFFPAGSSLDDPILFQLETPQASLFRAHGGEQITEDCKRWASLSHGPLSFVQIWLGAGSFGSVEWWRERGCMWINETLSWIGAWDFHPLAWSLMHRPRHVQARYTYRGNSNELVLILWLLAHQSRAKPIPVFTQSFFKKAWRLFAAFDLENHIAYISSWLNICHI